MMNRENIHQYHHRPKRSLSSTHSKSHHQSTSPDTNDASLLVEECDRMNPLVLLSARQQARATPDPNSSSSSSSSQSSSYSPSKPTIRNSHHRHPSCFERSSNRDETYSRQQEWEHMKNNLIYGDRQWNSDEDDDQLGSLSSRQNCQSSSQHHHHLLLRTEDDRENRNLNQSSASNCKSNKNLVRSSSASVAMSMTPARAILPVSSQRSADSSGSSKPTTPISISSTIGKGSSRGLSSDSSRIPSPYSPQDYFDQLSPVHDHLSASHPANLTSDSETSVNRRQSLPPSAALNSMVRSENPRVRSSTVANAANGLLNSFFQRPASTKVIYPSNQISDSPLALTDDDLRTLGMSGSELVRHRVKQDWNRDSGESINRIANTAPPHSTIFTNNQSYPHSFNLTSDNQKSYLVGRRSSLSNNPLSNHMFCNSSPISSVPRSINNSNQFRSARPPKFIFQILLSFDEREKSCLQAVIHLRNLKNGIVHPKAITNQPTQSLASKSNNGSGKSNNSNIDKSSTEVKNVPRPKILYKIPNIIKREDESNRSSPLKSNDSFENQFSRKINLKENQRDPNLMGSLSKNLSKNREDKSRLNTENSYVRSHDNQTLLSQSSSKVSNRRIINGFDRRHLIEQVVKIDWSDGTSESFDPTGLALDLILKKCYCFN